MGSHDYVSSISHRWNHRWEENISLSFTKMLQYFLNRLICSHLHKENIFTFSILKKPLWDRTGWGGGLEGCTWVCLRRENRNKTVERVKGCLLITAFNSFIWKAWGKTEDQIAKHIRDPTGLCSKWKHHVPFTIYFVKVIFSLV